MRYCIFLLTLVFSLFACAQKQEAVLQVVLLAGQSNMVGHGDFDKLDQELVKRIEAVSDRVFVSSSNNSKLPAKALSASFSITEPKGKYPFPKHFGPELFIGLTLAEAHPTKKFLLIKKAVGGTSLYGAWNPNWTAEKANEAERGDERKNMQLFKEHVTNIENQLTKLKKAKRAYQIIGLAWMQGEGDTNKNSTARSYKSNLEKLIASYRKELNAPNLPFVIGQINVLPRKFKEGPGLVRAAMLAVAKSDKKVAIIETVAKAPWTDFPKHSDNLHYNCEGQKRLGIAFGQEFMKFNIEK